ncbi:G2/mitotic-specific cyclin-B3-like [Glossina fuscipes]|uniref:G2/mitotic-specific cyclin-B3-like n=1 Tax=Glossina fuscipes TaxID=7396 RepID=A0A9C6DPR8_9MUSC|nr:G2/mitotic-specific cyclin-B3-like [Glossina fuscipes]
MSGNAEPSLAVEKSETQPKALPIGLEDLDKANWNISLQVYVVDILNYLKSREAEFSIDDYMKRQVHLSKSMHALLVDSMVEIQETFELSQETLYLSMKVVDFFLCKAVIKKDKLQLLGVSALLIASKFIEGTFPSVKLCCVRGSRHPKMAAAGLFIALRMVGEEQAWNTTLEYYSGHKLVDFAENVATLYTVLHRKSKDDIKTIRNKYLHKIFHELAEVVLMTTKNLFEKPINLTLCSNTAPLTTL